MLRYQNLINNLYLMLFLFIGTSNSTWAQTNTLCTPYLYFDASPACASLKNQAPAKIQYPNYVEAQKDYKISLSDVLGAPKSLQEAFPRLSNAIQQNHFEFPAWQIIIDKSMHHIFNLKSMVNENYLCKGLPLISEQLRLQLGISSSLAMKIHEKCKKINPHGSGNYFGNQVATKFYIFVKLDNNLTEGKSFPFTGWTDAANTTYLFIRPSTTWGDLELALIHELAIGMDSKGIHGLVQFALAYPTATVPMGSKMEEEWKPLFYMSGLPEIQYAFAAMRANRFMQMAFDEVNQKESSSTKKSESTKKGSNFFSNLFSGFSLSKNSELPNESRESLVKEFRYFVEQTKSWEIPTTDTPLNLLQRTSLNEIKKHFPQIKTLDDVIQAVIEAKETVLLYSGGPEVDFLTYMSMPLFGQKSHQTFLSNGPGCGYCGGSNKQEHIETWNRFWDQKIAPQMENSQPKGDSYE